MHSLDYRWTLTHNSFLVLYLITRFLCEFWFYFIWFWIILSDLLWLLLLNFHFISFHFIVWYNLIMQEVQPSIRHSKEQSRRISQAKSLLQLWRGLLNSSPGGISFDNYWIWKGKQHCNILYLLRKYPQHVEYSTQILRESHHHHSSPWWSLDARESLRNSCDSERDQVLRGFPHTGRGLRGGWRGSNVGNVA